MSVTPFTKRPSYDWNVIQCIWAGTYVDGTPAAGVIAIKYDGVGPMLDDDPTLPLAIFSTTVEVPIVTTTVIIAGETRTVGYASIWLPATNDPDIQGGGGTYTFSERLEREGGRSDISFVVDKDTPGGIIYLHKVAGSIPGSGTPLSVVYWSDFIALEARVDVLEGAGAGLPTQTGQTGKWLKTDGTNAQWDTMDPVDIVGSTATGIALLTAVDAATALTTIGGSASGHVHTFILASVPAGYIHTIQQASNGTWPAAGSSRTDIVYLWISYPGNTTAPTGFVAGARNLVDFLAA